MYYRIDKRVAYSTSAASTGIKTGDLRYLGYLRYMGSLAKIAKP